MENEAIGQCWQCGAELHKHDFGRETNCLSCGKPTRVCLNCRWYDTASSDQCREPSAEPVLDKSRANYCEFFEPAERKEGEGAPNSNDTLRQAAEDLFKS